LFVDANRAAWPGDVDQQELGIAHGGEQIDLLSVRHVRVEARTGRDGHVGRQAVDPLEKGLGSARMLADRIQDEPARQGRNAMLEVVDAHHDQGNRNQAQCRSLVQRRLVQAPVAVKPSGHGGRRPV